MRILVVEDDRDLSRQLVRALSDAGYAVDSAMDGEEGYFLGETEPYDIVVLDIGLPKMDGISILEQWRRAERNMPVIILTARDRWSDKVAGMDAGADDYVAKPFHMEELLARIRAQVRRSAGHARAEIECGPLRLDTKTARITLATFAKLRTYIRELCETGGKPMIHAAVMPFTSIATDRAAAFAQVNIDALIAEANKFPTWVKPPAGVFFTLDDIRGFILAGTPADIARESRAYEEAGAMHIVYDLRFRFADWLEQIDMLGSEVLPELRG